MIIKGYIMAWTIVIVVVYNIMQVEVESLQCHGFSLLYQVTYRICRFNTSL